MDETSEWRMDAPTDITRTFEFRADPSTDGLNLEGYAAVFDEWTTIDSWEGTFQEQLKRGAFKKTLKERTPVLQFDHGNHPMVGSIPLGRFTAVSEDATGLHVQARLSDNWLVQPVRDAIRDGGITGMSIRFRVVKDAWNKPKDGTLPQRSISEVALYEAGPVVFPAYATTSVGVRSRDDVLTSLLDNPERRAELARLLTIGTPLDPEDGAASSNPEPQTPMHSVRTRNQRRAYVALRTQF